MDRGLDVGLLGGRWSRRRGQDQRERRRSR